MSPGNPYSSGRAIGFTAVGIVGILIAATVLITNHLVNADSGVPKHVSGIATALVQDLVRGAPISEAGTCGGSDYTNAYETLLARHPQSYKEESGTISYEDELDIPFRLFYAGSSELILVGVGDPSAKTPCIHRLVLNPEHKD